MAGVGEGSIPRLGFATHALLFPASNKLNGSQHLQHLLSGESEVELFRSENIGRDRMFWLGLSWSSGMVSVSSEKYRLDSSANTCMGS
jgi:hypothetical protein